MQDDDRQRSESNLHRIACALLVAPLLSLGGLTAYGQKAEAPPPPVVRPVKALISDENQNEMAERTSWGGMLEVRQSPSNEGVNDYRHQRGADW